MEDTYFTHPPFVKAMLGFADTIKDVQPDEVGKVYRKMVYQIDSPGSGFTLSYAMQYLAESKPPFFSYLYSDVDDPIDLEVWNCWEAGIGDLEEKVSQGKEGLIQLSGLGIGGGSTDNYSQWAVPGTDELQRILNEVSIPHERDEYSGGGYELKDRLGTVTLPFFAEHLETEPSMSCGDRRQLR